MCIYVLRKLYTGIKLFAGISLAYGRIETKDKGGQIIADYVQNMKTSR
jgi:hypothetical protein